MFSYHAFCCVCARACVCMCVCVSQFFLDLYVRIKKKETPTRCTWMHPAGICPPTISSSHEQTYRHHPLQDPPLNRQQQTDGNEPQKPPPPTHTYPQTPLQTHLYEARQGQLEAPVANTSLDPREIHTRALRLFIYYFFVWGVWVCLCVRVCVVCGCVVGVGGVAWVEVCARARFDVLFPLVLFRIGPGTPIRARAHTHTHTHTPSLLLPRLANPRPRTSPIPIPQRSHSRFITSGLSSDVMRR
jgi:hypothetical protein